MILRSLRLLLGLSPDRGDRHDPLVENDAPARAPTGADGARHRPGRGRRGRGGRSGIASISGPSCYYRVSSTAPLTRCGRRARLAALRAATKRSLVPGREDGTARDAKAEVRCAEDGLVLVYPTLAESCPALTMDDTRDFAGVDCEPSHDLGELLRPDQLTPHRWCKYDATIDSTRRPFSCSGGSGNHGDVTTNARRSVSRPWRRPRPSRASRQMRRLLCPERRGRELLDLEARAHAGESVSLRS